MLLLLSKCFSRETLLKLENRKQHQKVNVVYKKVYIQGTPGGILTSGVLDARRIETFQSSKTLNFGL